MKDISLLFIHSCCNLNFPLLSCKKWPLTFCLLTLPFFFFLKSLEHHSNSVCVSLVCLLSLIHFTSSISKEAWRRTPGIKGQLLQAYTDRSQHKAVNELANTQTLVYNHLLSVHHIRNALDSYRICV